MEFNRSTMQRELDYLVGREDYIAVLDLSAVMPKDNSKMFRVSSGRITIKKESMPFLEEGMKRFMDLGSLISNRITMVALQVHDKIRTYSSFVKRVERDACCDLWHKKRKLEIHPEIVKLREYLDKLDEFKKLTLDRDPRGHNFVYGPEYLIQKNADSYQSILEKSKLILPSDNLLSHEVKAHVFSISYYFAMQKNPVVLISGGDHEFIDLTRGMQKEVKIKSIEGSLGRAQTACSSPSYSMILFNPNFSISI